jgi:peptidyl-prolyl cis-trans isomerase B (cyclophilin B)
MKVRLETTLGNITLELDESKAPKTVANFLQYVGDAFYDGTIFHRVIDGFMIQGGGFEPGMSEKPTKGSIEKLAQRYRRYRDGTHAGPAFGIGAVLH